MNDLEQTKPFTVQEVLAALSRDLILFSLDLKLRLSEALGSFRVEGRENLPEKGPFLVIANHKAVGETPFLLALLKDYEFHLVAGLELNWKRSSTRALLLKTLGMMSVEETLSNLSPAEREELLKRVPGPDKAGYARIVAKDDFAGAGNRAFFIEALEQLKRGGVLGIYPEGLLLYDGPGLSKAYPGAEILAFLYKRQMGQDLPIVPIGITPKSAVIGKPIKLAEHDSADKASHTDWMMRKLAELLPPEFKGVYGSE